MKLGMLTVLIFLCGAAFAQDNSQEQVYDHIASLIYKVSGVIPEGTTLDKDNCILGVNIWGSNYPTISTSPAGTEGAKEFNTYSISVAYRLNGKSAAVIVDKDEKTKKAVGAGLMDLFYSLRMELVDTNGDLLCKNFMTKPQVTPEPSNDEDRSDYPSSGSTFNNPPDMNSY